MSRENVDVVRSIYRAWQRQESAGQWIAADVEYVNPSYAVEPGTRYGRKSFAEVRTTYADFKLEIERIVDTDGDDVVVLARYTGSGRGSGVPVAGEHGYVWTIRGGLGTRFRWYQSHREALEAVGLSE
ncbi:MAG: hypothetical protein NVSMB51_06670 [Solirubrobacteraceae bacterium]